MPWRLPPSEHGPRRGEGAFGPSRGFAAATHVAKAAGTFEDSTGGDEATDCAAKCSIYMTLCNNKQNGRKNKATTTL